MAVKVRQRGENWWCFADYMGQRKAKLIGPGKAGKKLADALRDQWDAQIKLGMAEKIFAPKAAPTTYVSALPRLRDALVEWIDRREKSGDTRGATGSAYRTATRTWIVDHKLPDGRLLGDLPVDLVSREMLGSVVTAIKVAKRSRSTVGHALNVMRGFYQEMVETKQIQVNPSADLKFFIGKLRKGRRLGIFTREECSTLMRAAEGTRWAAFVAAALGTGARWGELAGLTRDDVDLKGRRLHVRQSWSPKAAAVQEPKNGKGRFVPLSKELVEILRAHVETRTAEGWGSLSLVFPGEDGRHMRHFHEKWEALLKRAGVPYRNFHSTRHTFASHALKASVRPELVQRWLGHSSLVMTLGTYAEFIPDSQADAADAAKLGSILMDRS